MIAILTVMGILGAVLVSRGYPWVANVLWGISNPLMTVHTWMICEKELSAMFAVYTLISWYGVYNLKPE